MKLLVATRNAGKLKEIRRLLADRGISVLSLADFPELPEVVEDGDTFADNARKKAFETARRTGLPTLADDSGLAVEALDGAPGVRSARYAGEHATDAMNNRKLLAAMRDIPAGRRQAAFLCAMALCTAEGECRLFAGRVEGEILPQPRGAEGFGYDPLFLVPEYGLTMAELSVEIKNRISHRGQALRQALAHLEDS